MTEVKATRLGNGRTALSIGQRTCIMEDHLDGDEQRAFLCPTEMLAAAIAG